jgi:hypothetical protein
MPYPHQPSTRVGLASKNFLEQHPPQRQEHYKIDEKATEAATNHDELTSPARGALWLGKSLRGYKCNKFIVTQPLPGL